MRWRSRFAALVVGLAATFAACGSDATHEGASVVRPEPTEGRPATASGGAGARESGGAESATAPPARLVAIGDVHGDLQAALETLRHAGLIDASNHWSGGETVLVQVGDLLDRGDQERELMDLFERLRDEAPAAGGRVELLLGNHEVMNAAGDLRYVTRGGLEQYAGTPPHPELEEQLRRAPQVAYGRLRAFLPGGPEALRLATYGLAHRDARAVFVHGGVLPRHLGELEDMESRTHSWLRGDGRIPSDVVMGEFSPLWTRRYSLDPDESACADADRVLEGLGVARMVVAHTVQQDGITVHCGGRVLAIDCGLSRYYGGPREVLELSYDDANPWGRARALRVGAEPRALACPACPVSR